MARKSRLTEQFPVVGTPEQKALIMAIQDRATINEGQAGVVRAGLDLLFGTVDGAIPGLPEFVRDPADSRPGHVQALEALGNTPEFKAVVERVVEHMTGHAPLRADLALEQTAL